MITPQTSRRLAWSVGLASIAMLLASLVFMFIDRDAHLSSGNGWNVPNVLNLVAALGVPVIGIVLITRVPENRIS